MSAIDRRRALSGTAAVAVGAPLLAACGSGSSATSGKDAAASSSVTSGTVLASTADVPVGGCFVVTGPKVVLTQPTAGDFKAFTAVCTHQGCVVRSSTDGTIPCPCHGSLFSLDDGSPQSGPASAPLAPVDITVDGDSILSA